MTGTYVAEINRERPGCILLLLDQSASMGDPFAGDRAVSKANAAADALNKLLMDLVIQCTQNFGEGPRNYFDVGVIGYGSRAGVGPCFGGALKGRELVSVQDLAAHQLRVEERYRKVANGSDDVVTVPVRFPVWFDPVAESGTPMAEALKLASKVVKRWVAQHMGSYPPIVINVTDGEPNSDPTKAAKELVSVQSDDGDVLLYNLHLSSLAVAPIAFPASKAKLPDKYAKMLFEMSSAVPPLIQRELSKEGYLVEPGTRGFVFNADAGALIQFLDIGTRLTFEGRAGER